MSSIAGSQDDWQLLTSQDPEGRALVAYALERNLPGQMQVTVSLRQLTCGTELNILQEGLPEVIPVEMCYLGWQESLAQLAKLVEPDIPD